MGFNKCGVWITFQQIKQKAFELVFLGLLIVK
jgi:hypothetical protein